MDSFTANYKLSKATLGTSGEEVTVALVGMHIIKKTPLSPQWVWATYEHKDNAPDIADTAPASSNPNWNFYNPSLPAAHMPNWTEATNADGDPNTPQDVPVQMVRVTPISADAVAINDAMHTYIDDNFSGSVWSNYNLVDIQWPTVPEAVPAVVENTTAYLPKGTPTEEDLANITMESFPQLSQTGGGGPDGVSSCIGCHSEAAITPTWGNPAWNTAKDWWMTDYSNIFFKAQYRVGD
jgi:hypothetical protein